MDLSSARLAFLLVVAFALISGAPATGFCVAPPPREVSVLVMSRSISVAIGRDRKKGMKHRMHGESRLFSKKGSNSDEEDLSMFTESSNDIKTTPGFDGKGFSGYLAPYVAATILSVAVTFFVFKFVFLDY